MRIFKPRPKYRPSKLNADVQKRLIEASKLGLTRELQCEYAGIGRSTLHRWLAKGRLAQKGKNRELWLALNRAEAEGAARAMKKIVAAQDKDWKAAAWFMERRHGYCRNGPAEASRERIAEQIVSEDESESLRRQIGEVQEANRQALTTGSFQAYFAGQRLARTLLKELKILTGDKTDPELEDMESERFASEFKAELMDMPDQLIELAIGVYEDRHEMKLVKVLEGGKGSG